MVGRHCAGFASVMGNLPLAGSEKLDYWVRRQSAASVEALSLSFL